MNFLKLTHEKLCIDAISSMVADNSCGAISLFAGTTRDNFEQKKVYSLEYEAYEPMATKQMQKICEAVREHWTDVVNIAVYHRLGLVPVREASVVIAISSPHRKSSLEAVAFAIEELKKQVPIWKKEKYEGDESSWKENKESSRYQNCKRPKLDLNKCTVVESAVISNNLVQIAANENEIRRRIQCFVAKKREEIDLNTLMDFTPVNRLQKELGGDIDLKESSCARTCNVIVKQEDSKCHLRVSRVKNRMGPQIRPDYLQTLDKLMSINNTQGIHIKQEPSDVYQEILDLQQSSGMHKRLSDVELHLNIKVLNTKHVYDRIKAIETRLLHLESISPEYKYFMADNFLQFCNSPGFLKTEKLGSPQKNTFNVDELDSIIEQMKQNDSDEEKPCHINEMINNY